jgi:hypothetical protein
MTSATKKKKGTFSPLVRTTAHTQLKLKQHMSMCIVQWTHGMVAQLVPFFSRIDRITAIAEKSTFR